MALEPRVIVTGGAGFIGRWVVRKLLADGHRVLALDDLSNGRLLNIEEFSRQPAFEFVRGDIQDRDLLERVFREGCSMVYHLGASINVQDSIDDPRTTFNNDVVGTFNVLEECRRHRVKMLFMSTCMVYERSQDEGGITELHPVKPASPYAASKLAGEALTLSYYHAYGLPTVVVRPFNTYGPFQKSTGEGGVVSIFIKKELKGEDLNIYGDGLQTRDLLYVADCADFVTAAGASSSCDGQIMNAGLGRDIAVNELAALINSDPARIKHVPHIHPQSEIPRLLCNFDKARRVLNWSPRVDLEEGISLTREWIAQNDQ